MNIPAPSSHPVDVSIITPTWNRAESLARALESVLRLDPPPVEHILLDNISSDGTREVIENYQERATFTVRYICEKDGGMYEAQNKGVALSSGSTLFFLNDDDEMDARNVLGMMCACMKQSGASLVFGDTRWRDPVSGQLSLRRHNQVNRLNLIHKGISQQALLYDRNLFQEGNVGHFDESFRIAGDYEWLLRALVKCRVPAAYLRFAVARCTLGGLSNAEEHADQRRRERRNAIDRYFSSRDVQLAGFYRRYARKVPFGTQLFGLIATTQLRLTTLSPCSGRFVKDWRPWFGY